MRHSLMIVGLLVCFAAGMSNAGQRENLISRYQKEKSELAKRDLALKMIDSGVIRVGDTTVADIARIFGKDWQPLGVLDKHLSQGCIYFAQQPPLPPREDIQAGNVGWYLLIDYITSSGQVVKWILSNQHK